MRVVDEQDRSKATITLYRMIKESENHTDAESLFERLFMQRPRAETTNNGDVLENYQTFDFFVCHVVYFGEHNSLSHSEQ